MLNKIDSTNFSTPNYGLKKLKDVSDENKIESSIKLNADLDCKAALGKSQVNFKGKFIKLNNNDLMFLSGIMTTFGLATEYYDKLKESLSGYLKTNDYASLSDIGGFEHVQEQCDLADEINKVLGFEQDKYKCLIDKIIERCDAGEDYFPSYKPYIEGQKDDDTYFENLLIEGFKSYVELSKKADSNFIDAICLTFSFNKEQRAVLENIIKEYMSMEGISSLGGFKDEDSIETQAAMGEKIQEVFNMSEEEGFIFAGELQNRIHEDIYYTPSINPIDRNTEVESQNRKVFNNIIRKYKSIAFNITSVRKLYDAMKQDAYEHNYQGTFDIFTGGKPIEEFKLTSAILDSKPFSDVKEDLLIDLHIAAKDMLKAECEVDETSKKNGEYYSLTCGIICELDKLFDFSKEELQKLRKYFSDKKPPITRDKAIWETAYNLVEDFNLSSNSTGKIFEIIKNINFKDEDEMHYACLNYAQLVISKSK